MSNIVLGSSGRRATIPATHVTAKPAAGASPIVKWVGGKGKLLPEIIRRLPTSFGDYYEPFAGGAALFFRLLQSKRPSRNLTWHLSDMNGSLINAYTCLSRDPDYIISLLRGHRIAHSEAYYYKTRDAWNKDRQDWTVEEVAAAFLYLNRACFNGLWRVNKQGEFNVPWCRSMKPSFLSDEDLRLAADALAQATLRIMPYEEAVKGAKRGDLVYFDPPYDPVTKTSNFTSYTADKFGPEAQAALAQTVGLLAARQVNVLVSNADTPRIRALYRDFRIDSVSAPRAVAADGAKRKAAAEVIVVAGPCA